MSENFEDIIRHKANDFIVEPDESDWLLIEQRLSKNNNRKSKILTLPYIAAATVSAVIVFSVFLWLNRTELNNNFIVENEQLTHPETVEMQKTEEEPIINEPENREENIITDKEDEQTNLTKIKNRPVTTSNQSVKNSLIPQDNENLVVPEIIEPEGDLNNLQQINENIDINAEKTNKNTETLLAENSEPDEKNDNHITKPDIEKPIYNFESTIELLKKENNNNKASIGLLFASNTNSFDAGSSPNSPLMMTDNGITYKKQNIMVTNVATSDSYSNANHDFPLSFGLSVQKNLNSRFAIQTGVIYTYMHSSFSSGRVKSNRTMHYIGIPLSGVVNLANFGNFSVYISGGGMVQKNIAGRTSLSTSMANSTKQNFTISQLQWSLNASAGLSYCFYKSLSLYIEPGWIYYFDNGSNVSNYYTQYPSSFNFQAGFRFSL